MVDKKSINILFDFDKLLLDVSIGYNSRWLWKVAPQTAWQEDFARGRKQS